MTEENEFVKMKKSTIYWLVSLIVILIVVCVYLTYDTEEVVVEDVIIDNIIIENVTEVEEVNEIVNESVKLNITQEVINESIKNLSENI